MYLFTLSVVLIPLSSPLGGGYNLQLPFDVVRHRITVERQTNRVERESNCVDSELNRSCNQRFK